MSLLHAKIKVVSVNSVHPVKTIYSPVGQLGKLPANICTSHQLYQKQHALNKSNKSYRWAYYSLHLGKLNIYHNYYLFYLPVFVSLKISIH